MIQKKITDDLEALLDVLPIDLANAVQNGNNSSDLIEIVIDLGRKPVARYTHGEFQLSERDIGYEDIDSVVNRIGDFDEDNRAGLERTLHRISAIRNRKSKIVGLTCRVGRAVYGTIEIIEDLIKSGKSILILGKPGIGKTTMLREAARVLAENTRVVIVDTSNEIGGDGDIPHPAVGKARRMQVATPTLQHEVMIEAVENHNPEVIVIDEIGRELEAKAARTIAERGVQLIGTAHGRTLENLLMNPTLSDLVGGIESVTLSDEEARRRRTQKTVLERRSPPTFDMLIEIEDRHSLVIHSDVAEAVDNLLRGNVMETEYRHMDENDKLHVEKREVSLADNNQQNGGFKRSFGNGSQRNEKTEKRAVTEPVIGVESYQQTNRAKLKTITIFPYGVARNRLAQAAKKLGVPLQIEKDIADAQVIITLRSHYRNRHHFVMQAENKGIPIFVLRSNTVNQMEKALAEMFNLSTTDTISTKEDAIMQAQAAIDAVMNGHRWIDLPPASPSVRKMQHDLVRQAKLISHSYGKEPQRYVRVFRE